MFVNSISGMAGAWRRDVAMSHAFPRGAEKGNEFKVRCGALVSRPAKQHGRGLAQPCAAELRIPTGDAKG